MINHLKTQQWRIHGEGAEPWPYQRIYVFI